tara:strand:+ start:374 stop:604 length:231 start_codon:yes stop_codon:yes gene_type:complete
MNSDVPCSPKSLEIGGIAKKVNRINKYTIHFGYKPKDLEDRLEKDEKKKLQELRTKCGEPKIDIEQFINAYNNRLK